MTTLATSSLAAFIRHEHARIDLALHEAGHAVAGVLHGGVVSSCTVTSGRVKSGVITQPNGSTSFSTLPSGRHAEVALAGPWGQVRGRTGRRPGPREIHAVLSTTGCRDREVLTAAGGSDSGDAVVPLLERCWPSVAELAALLFRTGKVSHTDVLAALKLSSDPQVRSIELAQIKAGAAPGTFTISRAAV